VFVYHLHVDYRPRFNTSAAFYVIKMQNSCLAHLRLLTNTYTCTMSAVFEWNSDRFERGKMMRLSARWPKFPACLAQKVVSSCTWLKPLPTLVDDKQAYRYPIGLYIFRINTLGLFKQCGSRLGKVQCVRLCNDVIPLDFRDVIYSCLSQRLYRP